MINEHRQSLDHVVTDLEAVPATAAGQASGLRQHLQTLALVLSPLLALALWVSVLPGTDLSPMSDLGLITVLPPAALLALFLLTLSFSVALTRETFRVPLMVLHVLVLIVGLYGAAILMEGSPRTSIAWSLVGIIDHVMIHGTVDLAQDAFQNWPGFYILVAFLASASGIETPLTLAAWAHVIFSLLTLGPLLFLFHTATRDDRLTWLGIWFFYLNNWIGQDYLAPQAFAYLLYLVMLGILLGGFQSRSWVWAAFQRRFRPGDAPEPDPGATAQTGLQRSGLMAIMIVFLFILVPTHQLTPVALLVSLAALVLLGGLTPRGLPLILGVLIVTWLSYMAMPFLKGHLHVFTEPLGSLSSNLNENVTDRIRGSPEHVAVVLLRIVLTLSVCFLAVVGAIRRIANGRFDLHFILLAVVPFPLLALQSYGGELVLRIYLFALPFASFFMAAVFLPRPDAWRSRHLAPGVLLVSAALGVAFFIARYGNERMDYFKPGEIEAMNHVYAVSEPGSQLVAASPMLAWRHQAYNTYTYSVVDKMVEKNDLDSLVELMGDARYPQSYLIITRSQEASATLLYGWAPGTWERFETSLLASSQFKTIFETPDAQVYVLAAPSQRAP